MEKQEKTIEDNKKEGEMAYFCKLCQCWHYQGSAIHYAHKKYVYQRVKLKKIVKRRKRSFWDRF